MEKGIILFVILSLMVSCSSEETQIRKKAENGIKETMNDPASYELISFDKINSLTMEDIFDFHRGIVEKNQGYNRLYIESTESAITSSQDYLEEQQKNARPNPELIDQYNDDIIRYNNNLRDLQDRDDWFHTYITNLEHTKEDFSDKLQKVVLENYALKMKGNDIFGNQVEETAYVQVDPATKEILNIAYSPEEMEDFYDVLLPDMQELR